MRIIFVDVLWECSFLSDFKSINQASVLFGQARQTHMSLQRPQLKNAENCKVNDLVRMMASSSIGQLMAEPSLSTPKVAPTSEMLCGKDWEPIWRSREGPRRQDCVSQPSPRIICILPRIAKARTRNAKGLLQLSDIRPIPRSLCSATPSR